MKRPPFLVQIEAQTTQLRERFMALQPRERQFVAAAVLVIGLALVYLVIWEPAASARSHAMQTLADARDTAVRIEHLAALAPVHASRSSTSNGQSLLSTVDQASKRSGLGVSPSRLQPDGDDRVRLWFDDVPFDALVGWLHDLREQDHISVESADFSRKDHPGVVDAQLTLVRSP